MEACPHLHRTVQQIRSLGKRASVSLNPHTSLDGLGTVLPDLSMVLLMTVNPGFGGQKFIDAVVPKIRELRAQIDRRGLDVDIEIDGGMTPETARIVVAAGANVLVAGSAVFGRPDYKQAIRELRDTPATVP
jgi:ribulose-phosphate 3-epimerase